MALRHSLIKVTDPICFLGINSFRTSHALRVRSKTPAKMKYKNEVHSLSLSTPLSEPS
ncbi:hypothetical protein I79_003399 [Cricetulus griseus]|uniref:Uncharacterized protein n=1 Tax=Cricetulus griseus TaxID=10029 RepID=G3GZV2_CRIGR|nr:hypothetical protein I79_003399 [Cricetulus griseus]